MQSTDRPACIVQLNSIGNWMAQHAFRCRSFSVSDQRSDSHTYQIVSSYKINSLLVHLGRIDCPPLVWSWKVNFAVEMIWLGLWSPLTLGVHCHSLQVSRLTLKSFIWKGKKSALLQCQQMQSSRFKSPRCLIRVTTSLQSSSSLVKTRT